MDEYVCTQCHYVGQFKRKKRGSTKTEVIAWLLFPLGIPYSLWRMCNKIKVCPDCESDLLVSSDSALGKRILDNMDAELTAKLAAKQHLPTRTPRETQKNI